ncbi:MAG TPA: hypothetical protein VFW29_10490 [Solirubrobacteraceae bacterium]|nr:hypothetical protein [Solirubrobacteraceae bacterium]
MRRTGLAASLLAATAAVLIAQLALGGALAPAARIAPSGLAYSSASARTVQRQPPAGSCHMIGSGLYARPDPRCTPGAVNPEVTQSTIATTICRPGWTATVRPAESITEPEKLASLRSYGVKGASRFEYDHFVPLELGGAVNDPRNLWPEPDYSAPSGFYLNPKDHLEYVLKRRVCAGSMTLAQAQRTIALDWPSAYRSFG